MKTGKKPVTVKLGTKARRVLTDAELNAVIEQTAEPMIIFYEYDKRLDRNADFFQEIREKNAFYFYGDDENPQEKLSEIVKDWLDGLNKLDDETEQHDKYEEVPQVTENADTDEDNKEIEEVEETPPTEQTEELNAQIEELTEECERLKLDNKNKNDDIKNFFEEVERLKSEIRSEQNKAKTAENAKEKVEAELQTANDEIERLNTIEIEEYKADKERAEKRISELDMENKELSAKAAEIEGLTSERDTLKSENERLNFEKQNWNTEKENLQNQKEDLQSRLDDLNTLFAATQEQIDQNAESTAEKDLTIEGLKKQLDEQTAKQARFDAVINEQLTNLIPEYRGAAQIVTVCGSGGVGVSNAVLSLSGAFSGERVLFIDLDLLNASCDVLAQISPISDELSHSCQSLRKERKTGLGVFLFAGLEAFTENAERLIKRCPKVGADYLSGLYSGASSAELLNADWAGLFGVLGERYDKIIVDAGRVGCSIPKDSVIFSVMSIAHKNIVITRNNGLDVRNMKLRLNPFGISTDKLLWVLNFSGADEQQDNVVGFLQGIQSIRILRLPSIKDGELFINSRFLRPKMLEIANIVKGD